MAFKLTYSDGQESQHDDDTVWELDDGVLKLGREKGKWSVLLSPSHWAVLELGGQARDGDGGDGKDKDSDSDSDGEDRDPKESVSDADTSDDSDKKNKDKKDSDNKDSDKEDDD
jgi:hypothetical protein